MGCTPRSPGLLQGPAPRARPPQQPGLRCKASVRPPARPHSHAQPRADPAALTWKVPRAPGESRV